MTTKEKNPLAVFVDSAGGGPDAETVRLGLDEHRIGLWPTANRLDLWAMSIEDLRSILEALITSPEMPKEVA